MIKYNEQNQETQDRQYKRLILISQTPNTTQNTSQKQQFIAQKKILHIKYHLFARACRVWANQNIFSYLMTDKHIVDSSF